MSEREALLRALESCDVPSAYQNAIMDAFALNMRHAIASAPQASQPPQGADKRVCSNCNGSGVVGIPGAPCPFCKLESLAWQWEPSPEEALAEYDAALAAPPQGASSLLPGWKLVPVEPTQAMLDAVAGEPGDDMYETMLVQYRQDWRDMLSASPLPAPQEPAARWKVGDRVKTPDGEGTITHIDPPVEARYHVHLGMGFGDVYERAALYAAPAPVDEPREKS